MAEDEKLKLEREKLELDREKIKFDRDKAAFDQNYSQFRSLNDHLLRLPTLYTTLTGGLWFAAGVQDKLPLAPEVRFALIYLAGWFGLMLILVMFRLRDVMQSYLDQLQTFNPATFASGQPKKPRLPGLLRSYSMVDLFAVMAFIAAALSWIGAFWLFWPPAWPSVWLGVGATMVLVVAMFWVIMLGKSTQKTL
jgi:hypothetical protein